MTAATVDANQLRAKLRKFAAASLQAKISGR
jgi:hypothetical protein